MPKPNLCGTTIEMSTDSRLNRSLGSPSTCPFGIPGRMLDTFSGGFTGTMSDQTLKVIHRVQKLLALSSSANVHEAASAAAAAQTLIVRYQLESLLVEEVHLRTAIEDGRDDPLLVARKIRKWKRVLASGLAEINHCKAFTIPVHRREQHLCILGYPEDRAITRTLWDWLVQRLEWLSATHGQAQSREWHESFRIGAANAIIDRLTTVEGRAKEAMETTALATVDASRARRRAAVAAHAEAQMNLTAGRRIRVVVDAHNAGREAGAHMPLPKTVS